MDLQEEIKKLEESIKKAQEVKLELENTLKAQEVSKTLLERFENTFPYENEDVYYINIDGGIYSHELENRDATRYVFNWDRKRDAADKRAYYIKAVNLAIKVKEFLNDEKLDWTINKPLKYCWIYERRCIRLSFNWTEIRSQIYPFLQNEDSNYSRRLSCEMKFCATCLH